MQNILNKLIHLIFKQEKIWEIKNKHQIPSMEWSLANLKTLGFNPGFAIDVGAYDGQWTRMFKSIFPDTKVLMIEAQRRKENSLQALTKKLNGTFYHIGLLGAEGGQTVTFNVNETVSSVLEEYKPNNFEKSNRVLETLDEVLADKFDLGFPEFIKLDVQGYELEILRGAKESIANVQFILCEVSLIEINKDCPLLADVVKFMDSIGFVAYDICSFIRRPLDKALWQTDIIFARKTNVIVANKYWN